MKKYGTGLSLLLLQALVFYLLPPLFGPRDAIGMVVCLLAVTFILSVLFGAVIQSELKSLYPIAAAIFFVPSVFLYYNETALIHILWYAVVSALGVALGTLIRKLVRKS